jgi:hypothetical protein
MNGGVVLLKLGSMNDLLRRMYLGISLILIGCPAAWAVELDAHRAIYEIELLRGGGGTDFTNVSGTMYLDWSDVCDGWTMTQHVRLFFSNPTGTTMQNDFSFSSWESLDGRDFRYSMLSKTNGKVNEKVEGEASIDPVTGMGRATFTKPEKLELELPVGTIFPTEHLFDTINYALKGGRILSRNVFSGTGDDSLNEVSAFIGPPAERSSLEERSTEEDKDTSWRHDLISWPVSMAYFPLGGEDSEPEFEIHFEILENGVSPTMDLDYGMFSIRGIMKHIEFYPSPTC